MGLNKNSAGGPDGMIGAFFQDSWDIIGHDVYNMVISLFCGLELPIFITHKNLAFLKVACKHIFQYETNIIE